MKYVSQRALIGVFIVALVGCTQISKQQSDEEGMTNEDAVTSLEDNLKTVVLVLGGSNGQPVVRGSGMFTSEHGLILTNAHVVMNDETGEVWPEVTILTTTDTREPAQCFATADVLAVDEEFDLALLEIASPLNSDCDEVTEFGDFWYTDLETESVVPSIGDELTAIGYPSYGDFSDVTVTVTKGHISGFVGGNGSDSKYIKTDTLINHGNSGGAAFDKEGNFVGIPSAIRLDTTEIGGALGVVIPASVVNHWFDRLDDQGIIEDSTL